MPAAKFVFVVVASAKAGGMINQDCPPLIHNESTWAFVLSVIDPWFTSHATSWLPGIAPFLQALAPIVDSGIGYQHAGQTKATDPIREQGGRVPDPQLAVSGPAERFAEHLSDLHELRCRALVQCSGRAVKHRTAAVSRGDATLQHRWRSRQVKNVKQVRICRITKLR